MRSNALLEVFILAAARTSFVCPETMLAPGLTADDPCLSDEISEDGACSASWLQFRGKAVPAVADVLQDTSRGDGVSPSVLVALQAGRRRRGGSFGASKRD